MKVFVTAALVLALAVSHVLTDCSTEDGSAPPTGSMKFINQVRTDHLQDSGFTSLTSSTVIALQGISFQAVTDNQFNVVKQLSLSQFAALKNIDTLTLPQFNHLQDVDVDELEKEEIEALTVADISSSESLEVYYCNSGVLVPSGDDVRRCIAGDWRDDVPGCNAFGGSK